MTGASWGARLQHSGVEFLAYYTDFEVRRAAHSGAFTIDARTTLAYDASASRSRQSYDIFLSHAHLDAEQILGLKRIFERNGQSVYIDWVDDAQLDRNQVTAATAELLRLRMAASASFIFATSNNTPDSKWMPWELGYFDGLRREKIAVLPLVSQIGDLFRGQEYLGLYPYMERLDGCAGPVLIDRANRRVAAMSAFTSRSPTEFRTF